MNKLTGLNHKTCTNHIEDVNGDIINTYIWWSLNTAHGQTYILIGSKQLITLNFKTRIL